MTAKAPKTPRVPRAKFPAVAPEVKSNTSFKDELRYQEFAEHFLASGMDPQAAYAECSWTRTTNKKSNAVAACLFMKKPGVQKCIVDALSAQKVRLRVDQDKLVKEQARIAFSRMDDYLTWSNDEINIKPSSELTEDQIAALESIEVNEFETEHGTRRRVKVKLYAKSAALESLFRYFGLYAPDQREVIHRFGVIKVPSRIEAGDWIEAIAREVEDSADGSGGDSTGDLGSE